MKMAPVLLALLLAPGALWAAPGDLDATFGIGGRVTTPFFGTDARANAIVVQPDGKLVAAGQSGESGHAVFTLARYNADGRLDPSFGTGGTVTTALGNDSGANAIVVQPDGKLVAAGQRGSGFFGAFALARYDVDGSLDPSFGSGGKVTPTFLPLAFATALVLQPDGKLVAAGTTGITHLGNALARYNPDGSLDTSFGFGGTVTSGPAGARALLLQPDGKLVAVASTLDASLAYRFILERYDADGSVDPTFVDGGATTGIGADAVARALVMQPDGKLIAAGETLEFGPDHVVVASAFVLTRYNADGSVDGSFGRGGTVTTHFGQMDGATSLAVQPDGKLVAAGYSTSASDTTVALAGYLPDGSLDVTFGSGGQAGSGVAVAATAMAVQPDGKLVLAGHTTSLQEEFALVRYEGPPSLCSGWCFACAQDNVPPSITKKFAGATSLIDQATNAPAPEHKARRKAKVALKAAARTARRATKGKHPKLSRSCAAAIRSAARALARQL